MVSKASKVLMQGINTTPFVSLWSMTMSKESIPLDIRRSVMKSIVRVVKDLPSEDQMGRIGEL